jgi:hypothetical protein
MGICPSFPAAATFLHYKRLQLKYQDHHLNTPYKIEHVYKAARFILQSSPAIGYQALNVANTSPLHTTPEPGIKKEDLGAFLTEFSNTIIEAIKSNKTPNGSTCSRMYHVRKTTLQKRMQHG